MNNFFRKLSRMGDTITSKSGNIIENVRKSVGLLTAATALSMGSGAIAGEWHRVDTRGIGPMEFTMKEFGNRDIGRLVDKKGGVIKDPTKDLIFGREYTQKPVASGQGDGTATSASRIISTPRPQPKHEAQVNIVSIGENSKGKVEKGNTAQTNSLTGPKKSRIPTKEFRIPENFDSIDFFGNQTGSQDTHPKSEGRINISPICENPNTVKQFSPIVIANVDAMEFFGKQSESESSGKVVSIEQARAKKLHEQQYINTQGKIIDLDREVLNEAVAHIESGGKYHANNINEGIKRGIKTGKFALGKYAITIDTLKGFGVIINGKGKDWREKVSAYLKNPKLQESIMEKYTDKSIKIIEENPKIIERIKNKETSVPEMVAQGHFEGHGSIGKTRKIKDWLGTPGSYYAKKVAEKYYSLLEKKKLNNTRSAQPTIMGLTIPSIQQSIQPEFSIPTSTIQESKDTIKPTIQAIGQENQEISSLILAPELEEITNSISSANDAIFATQQITHSVISPIDEKRIQIAKLTDIAQDHLKIAQEHRMEAARLRNEAKNRFGNDWELNRKRLNKRANTHQSNAEAYENRANTLNNTIMRMSNNQPLKKAA